MTIPQNPGKPFKIEIAEAELDRLERRLNDAHLPTREIVPNAEWDYGTELTKLKQLVEDWKKGSPRGSDEKPKGPGGGVKKWWRKVEERLNRYPHYLVEIEGVQVHFQLARSSDPNAIPLIFSHGWPGSFVEADLLLDELTRTDRNGPSFHLVVPSLPGYGFSGPPPRRGWHLSDTARLFDKLMTDSLNCQSYMAQGGDWGYMVTRYLSLYPACKIFHTNFAPPNIPLYAKPVLELAKAGYDNVANRLLSTSCDEFEMHGVKRAVDYLVNGSGYFLFQSTKPATVGYGLFDSPVAVLSYLLEKFQVWSDPRCPAFSPNNSNVKTERSSGMNDENILINTTIYCLTDSIHTSFLPYYESENSIQALSYDHKLTAPAARKPFGHSAFPYEFVSGPKKWLPRLNVNLCQYKRHEYGGHFAALDAPQALSQDVREFAAAYWPDK